MKSKFTGALIGSAVGDALGAPVEGYSMKKVSSVYGEDWKMISGRYTDDTEMMIGVAESLIENKGFNGNDMAMRFIQNYDPRRGYGPGSKEALRRIGEGESWEEASKKLFDGKGSYGNGAAMRIAPVGIFYYDDADKLREIAYKSSHITHSNELGKEGAALQAFSIALAVQRRVKKEDMLLELKEFVKSEIYKEKLRKMEVLLEKEAEVGKKEVISELGNGEETFNSVPTAIHSFLRFNNFKDSVVYAVSLGGDTDTIGAMTGAISGAYYGEEAIPKEWVERLEGGKKGRSYIKWLGEELYRIKFCAD
ncbi:MAG: ADP-ribosylglycohydrolase family protein [Methanophagales archaeon]|nr:ADP-ribosylglycohydrolase family protein [Methanophagales archaeon]